MFLMKYFTSTLVAGLLAFSLSVHAEIKIVSEHNSNGEASSKFKFKTVPPPSNQDAATSVRFTIVDGERDENGGELGVLNDGNGSTEEDQPAANFFFNACTDGARLLIDFGSLINIKEVNTYSWHPNTRGPQ